MAAAEVAAVRIAVISPTEHRRGRAGLRIEQDDDALVRAAAFGEILGIDADQLGAERFAIEHRAGHHAEGAPLGQVDDPAQQLPRPALRQGDHRLAHQRDAFLIGEAAGDLLGGHDLEVHARASRFASAIMRSRSSRTKIVPLNSMTTP